MNKVHLNKTLPGYDIVIIGAGPAGCVTAKYIGQEFKVLLVDYKSLPRNKPCGGLLVTQAIEELKHLDKDWDFVVEPKDLDIEYLDVDNNAKKEVSKGFVNIDRAKFDSWLLSMVPDSVHVLEKTKLVDFNSTKDKKYQVLIFESNGEIKSIVSNFIIGADGALSTVREGLQHKKPPYYIAIQERVKGNGLDRAVFVYKDEITDFYSWLIPKGKETLLGAALKPLKSREKFNEFKAWVEKEYKLQNKGAIDSALILRPESKSDIFIGNGNVLLVGEAAGLISPSSGEGISFALESGRLCAESFLESNQNPFAIYNKKVQPLIERVLSKINKSKIIYSSKSRKILFK